VSGADQSTSERGGLLSGKLLIAITLSLVVLVPLITVTTLQWVRRDIADKTEALSWDERQSWQGMPTTPVSFRRGLMSSARTGKTFEDFGFHLTASREEALRQCIALARQSKPQFRQAATRQRLNDLADQYPKVFYANYLLGTWHRLNGKAADAARHYRQAFEKAGTAVIVPYRDEAGQPAQTRAVGELAIALDRVRQDVLIQDLTLIYPFLRTDATGRVYLPVHPDTPYRLADADQRAGTQPQRQRGWFTFPGQIGRLKPRPVTSR
jgi:hypothetical protein